MDKNYEYVIMHMRRNDPNGEYDVESLKKYTWTYLDILQAWYYDLKDADERVPGWLVACIQWLGAIVE